MEIVLNILIMSLVLTTTYGINCNLPKNCRIQNILFPNNLFGNDQIYMKNKGIKCTIQKEFTFDMENKLISANNKSRWCKVDRKIEGTEAIEFGWPKKNQNSILKKQHNLAGFIQYLTHYYYLFILILLNTRGVELNLANNDRERQIFLDNHSLMFIVFINSNMEFYIDDKPIKNCWDILRSSRKTNFSSIFQSPIHVRDFEQGVEIIGSKFKLPMCPLVFKNSLIGRFYINNLADTFYTTNVLRFTNDSFDDLNATIHFLHLYHVERIDIDERMLNPSVFKQLFQISINGFVHSVSSHLFESLPNLKSLIFKSTNFRGLIHRHGIEWIKSANRHLNVNLSDNKSIEENFDRAQYILLSFSGYDEYVPISQVFPDEDFCIYHDFPFNRLVFSFEFSESEEFLNVYNQVDKTYSCTYLWINQYSYIAKELLKYSIRYVSMLTSLLESESFKNMGKCNFKQRLKRCNKLEYEANPIWTRSDYLMLNKKLQTAVKISKYLISVFSFSTNLVVVMKIFGKANQDTFKDLKHYKYLGLISVFSVVISTIEFLSWFSECFYPFQAFCLITHKFVFFQLFKMVFKECLVNVLRFASNFCYVAFALNRIALIQREPGFLVRYMAKVNMKKYVLSSLAIGLVFSWIKYFKYQINFDRNELSFPMSNELDIFTIKIKKPPILDFYFIFSCFCDILNYVLFVVVCFCIDIYMMIKLRSALKESIQRLKSLNTSSKNIDKKSVEFEDTINQSARMVVVNTAIGLMLKSPMACLPLVNAYAQFYYKEQNLRFKKPAFDRFFYSLVESGSYVLFVDFSELLFLVSISIQLFIYNRFDKKFKSSSLLENQNNTRLN